jgi:hypothetical protein
VEHMKVSLPTFPGCVVYKVNREGNRVAHSLARLGNSMSCGHVVIESYPPCVEDLINQDCMQNAVPLFNISQSLKKKLKLNQSSKGLRSCR